MATRSYMNFQRKVRGRGKPKDNFCKLPVYDVTSRLEIDGITIVHNIQPLVKEDAIKLAIFLRERIGIDELGLIAIVDHKM